MRATAALLAASLALAFAVPADADVLSTPDGQRLVGRVVSIQDGLVEFDSELFGILRVSLERVSLQRDATVALDPTPGAESGASRWVADVSTKLAVDRGSLKEADDDLDFGVKLERHTANAEWRADLGYSYRKTDGRLKDDDTTASLSYDRSFGRSSFLAGRILGANELTDDGWYDLTRSVLFAYGRRFGEGRRSGRVGVGPGWLRAERADETEQGAALGLYARGKMPIGRKVEVNGELQLLAGSSGTRYGRFDLHLRHPLGERLYLALEWDYVWSELPIETGVSSQWRWVLGWRFPDREP